MNPNEVPCTKKGLVMLQKINWGRTMVSSSSTPSALWGVMFGGGGVGWLITIDHDAFGKVGLEMLFSLAKFSKSFEGWWPFPSGVDISRSPSRSGTKVFDPGELFDVIQVVWPLKLKIDIRLCSSCVFPTLFLKTKQQRGAGVHRQWLEWQCPACMQQMGSSVLSIGHVKHLLGFTCQTDVFNI